MAITGYVGAGSRLQNIAEIVVRWDGEGDIHAAVRQRVPFLTNTEVVAIDSLVAIHEDGGPRREIMTFIEGFEAGIEAERARWAAGLKGRR